GDSESADGGAGPPIGRREREQPQRRGRGRGDRAPRRRDDAGRQGQGAAGGAGARRGRGQLPHRAGRLRRRLDGKRGGGGGGGSGGGRRAPVHREERGHAEQDRQGDVRRRGAVEEDPRREQGEDPQPRPDPPGRRADDPGI
ncbi:MAG: hypothetical protein AVDCRST_MAG38-613, partial [uncultured Solirubrobacteraceae bacterium]